MYNNYPLSTQLRAIRRTSTPLVALSTPDPQATQAAIAATLNAETAVVAWDCLRGIFPVTPTGRDVALSLERDAGTGLTHPADLLAAAQKLAPGAVLILHGLHRLWDDAQVLQGLRNLRDPFKGSQRTCIMLVPPVPLPADLSTDVVCFDEPLPGPTELEAIVKTQYQYAEIPHAPETETTIAKAVEALRGLPAFTAEQELAMSLTPTGVNLDVLYERKRKSIEGTPGLSVWRGSECFSAIGGLAQVKRFLSAVLQGKRAPRAVVWVDEIEKSLAGAQSDTSGVSQDYLGTLLSHMQDRQADGLLLVGPPGSGKSLLAKATGAEAGVPTVRLDLGGMKGSLVGESEARLRQGLAIIDAISDGQALWMATCNNLTVLPPELRRRFKLGIVFVDLPSADERAAIWQVYQAQYPHLDWSARPPDTTWVGSDIATCVMLADRLRLSLLDAAEYVVPVAVSAAEQVERLRKEAHGRYLSASLPGPYRYKEPSVDGLSPNQRAIRFG